MKVCRRCELHKDDADFYPHKQTKDGLDSWCKACSRMAKREAARKRRNRDKAMRAGRRPRHDKNELLHPYHDHKSPMGVRFTFEEWCERKEFTASELQAIEQGVQALRTYETDMARRVQDPNHNGRSQRDFPSAFDIVETLGFPWRRQVSVFNAIVLKAHEEGISMTFTSLSTWRKELLAEVA